LTATDLITLRTCFYEYILYSNNGVTLKYQNTVGYLQNSLSLINSINQGYTPIAGFTGFQKYQASLDLSLLDNPQIQYLIDCSRGCATTEKDPCLCGTVNLCYGFLAAVVGVSQVTSLRGVTVSSSAI
jgi:hypothetical protein